MEPAACLSYKGSPYQECTMGLPALQEQFEDGVRDFVDRDWEAEFAGVDTLEELASKVAEGAKSFKEWRASMSEQLRAGLDMATADAKENGVGLALTELDALIRFLSESIDRMRSSIERFDGEGFARAHLLPVSTRRYMNKQKQRVRQILADIHDFYVDAYYAALATQTRIEDMGAGSLPSFTDGEALAEYLRKETA